MRKNWNHSFTSSHIAVVTFSLYIFIHGIDTTADAGRSSNLDFVYFILRYLDRFSFKKHALVIHPSDDLFPTRPRLLTLRHYGAASDGWNDSRLRPLCRALPGVSSTFRHPQHTRTSSNSSTIAADSSNSVTNTRCCRYSCIRSWWWVEVPPETRRAVSK
jgi:hypothetical protein